MAKKAPRRTAERILEVTLELFNRFGEPNVSTTLISAELGISPGNLYYHFPAKDELINSLFDRYEQALNELLHAGMDDFLRKPYRSNEIYQCMAKHLGVRYVYSNEPVIETADTAELTPAMLQGLPPALRTELTEALLSLDSDRIDAVIQKIAQSDATLGKVLAHTASNFDYPAILRALEVS